MTPPDDRCGARTRRAQADREPAHVPETGAVRLTSAGRSLMALLREDPRYRDLLAAADDEEEDPAAA